jgi:hypothetical protein
MMRRVALTLTIITVLVSICVGSRQSQGLGGTASQVPGNPIEQRRSVVNDSKEIVITVTQQPNPLLQVATELSNELDVPISYEEPSWAFGADLMRFLDSPQAREADPEVVAKMNPKFRSPALGSAEVHRTIRKDQDKFEIAGSLLQESIEDHASRGNPGLFKIVRINNYGFTIVPTNIRGDKDQRVSTSSPLDERISIPKGARTFSATLELIGQEVANSYRQHFTIANRSLGDLASQIVHTSGDSRTARDLLVEILREATSAVKSRNSQVNIQTLQFRWYLQYLVDGEYVNPYSDKTKDPIFSLQLLPVLPK